MASNKPPANQQARSVAESSSLLERASAQFGDFQRKAFSLPLAAVPQLEWEKEAFAAAQRDAQMQEMEAALHPLGAQVGQSCMGKNNPNRIIIIDTPPALVASVAAEIAPHAGQCLLIGRAGVTGQSALEDCVALLSGYRSIKLLLNAAFFSPSGRKFGSYYGEAAASYGEKM